MSYNTYGPRYWGRNNTRRVYEVGDELAPGGPVGFRRVPWNRNHGMNDQDEDNLRQLDSPPPEPWFPPPLTRLRQPTFRPQCESPQEFDFPPPHDFQGRLTPGRRPIRSIFNHEPISPVRDPQRSSPLEMRMLKAKEPQRASLQERGTSPVLKFQDENFLPTTHFEEPPIQRDEFLPVRRLRQPTVHHEQFPPAQRLRQPSRDRPPSPTERAPAAPGRSDPPTRPRDLSPEPSRPSPPPQGSPPPRDDVAELPTQVTEEEMQTDSAATVETSLDKGNTESTSGGHDGAKVKRKVPNREWRRRQNLHLRRILAPKNALIVLNEMLSGEKAIGPFKVEPAPACPPSGAPDAPHARFFCAELTVDGVDYKGYGRSKLAARNDAAEQVFRDLILRHMVKLQRRNEARERGAEGAHAAAAEDGGDDDDDTLPMLQLASFALHKLFAEWECRGHKVPRLRALAASAPGEECEPTETIPRGAKPRRPLPTNAGAMHPCLLLAHLRPELHFRALVAAAPYTMAVDVDGVTYRGTAGNKRDARREAARAACSQHFGVVFDAPPAPAAAAAPASARTPRPATAPAPGPAAAPEPAASPEPSPASAAAPES